MDLLFIFKLCIILSHFERVWTKPNGEIDDFINKLLRSDKFDELAEKVAEKAARKIFDLDHIRISHNIKTRKEKPYKSKQKSLRERDNDDSSEENIKEKRIKIVTTEKDLLNEIQEPSTTKQLKIKATVSKEILSSEEQLPLKFKNLSKASRGNANKHQKTENESNIRENRINFETTGRSDRKDKQLKSRFEKVNNHRKESQMKDKYMSSENEKISHKDTNEEKGNKSEGDDKKNESVSEKGSKEKNRSSLTPEKDIENGNISNDSNERNESQNKVLSLEKDNGTLSKEIQISKQNAVQKIGNRAINTSELEKERDSSEESIEDVRKSFSKTTRKLIIRREGDKLIAFENQSDYKEYEEKVLNQKKEKKGFIL